MSTFPLNADIALAVMQPKLLVNALLVTLNFQQKRKMNYQQLPLINVYPISESPISPWDLAMAQAGGILRVPEVANTPLEFAEITARNFFVNGLQISLDFQLKNSLEYKACKNLMPSLARVPHLKKYRTEYPHFDLSSVDSEIHHFGGLLQPGQVVFHGGVWPISLGNCIPGQKFTLTKPLSTTLSAGVAGAHANTHAQRQLWVITVARTINTPAFVFSNNRNQFLHYELEILFANGATIECTAERLFPNYQLIEVLIS